MKKLQENLENRNENHILPFLWMKGEDQETIRREMGKIAECGIREVCLESRPHPDFCGPLWWESLDTVIAEAKRLGMRVWILDDRRFPTGWANGGFEKHPELAKIYLTERHM
ncbi:MAG: glycoside hydrolase, partial [Parasporobacterium sp.]|nr:glycoside hydrolase [Parasporobacterium sp.]